MLDQNENVVPNDLIVLALTPSELTQTEIDEIMALDWYRPSLEYHRDRASLILVSERALNPCLFKLSDSPYYTLADAGIRHLHGVDFIDNVLHRHEPRMFYHA